MTVEQILALFENSTPEKIEQIREDKELLTWYASDWLPCAAGNEYYSSTTNILEKYTDKMGVGGKMKVRVTVSSEAFGLCQMENCSEKWPKIFQKKQECGEKWKVPRSGDAAEPYKAKFTETKSGGVRYGGFTQAGLDYYETILDRVQAIRKADADKGHPMAIYMLKLCQEKKALQNAGKTTKASKKRTSDTTTSQPPAKKIKVIDE